MGIRQSNTMSDTEAAPAPAPATDDTTADSAPAPAPATDDTTADSGVVDEQTVAEFCDGLFAYVDTNANEKLEVDEIKAMFGQDNAEDFMKFLDADGNSENSKKGLSRRFANYPKCQNQTSRVTGCKE